MLTTYNELHPEKRFSAIVLLFPIKVTRSTVAYISGKRFNIGVIVLQGSVMSLILEHPLKVPIMLNATQPQSLPE